MRLGIVSDTHFRGKDLAIKTEVWAEVLSDMKRRGVSWVISSGDFFDNPFVGDKYAAPAEIMGRVVQPIKDITLPLVVLEGNHDWDGIPHHPSALQMMEGHPLIRTVYLPKIVSLGGIKIGCLPWPARWASTMKTLSEQVTYMAERVDLVVGHLELLGSCTPRGLPIPPGAFTIDPKELIPFQNHNVPVILGHVHNRQGHYAGALCPLRMDERDNPAGWVLYDGEKHTCEFIRVENPVKFSSFILEPGEDGSRALGMGPRAFVRIVASEPPARLPDLKAEYDGRLVIASTPTKACLVAPRAQVSPEMELSDLFQRWSTVHSVTPTPNHFKFLDEVRSSVPRASGCKIFKIKSLHLKGLGPHVDLSIEFQADWTAIVGPSGSGKTFTLEAVLVALYGAWESPGRDIFSQTLPGSSASLSCLLEGPEGDWEVKRTWRRSSNGVTQEAILTGPDGSTITGVQKVNEILLVLAGPRRTFLKTVFLSQDPKEDVVGATRADRMDFIRGYMGLDDYDIMAMTTRSRLQETEGSIQTLAGKGEEFARAKEQYAAAAHLSETARAEWEALKIHEREMNAQISKLKDNYSHLQGQLSMTRDVQQRLDALVADVETRQQMLQKLREKLTRLEVTFQELESRRPEFTRLHENIANLRAAYDLDMELRENRRLLREQKTQLASVTRLVEIVQTGLSKEITACQAEVSRCKAQMRGLDRAGCRPNFLVCPLITEAQEAGSRSLVLEKKIADLEDMILRGDFAHEHRAEMTQRNQEIKVLEHLITEGEARLQLLMGSFTEPPEVLVKRYDRLETEVRRLESKADNALEIKVLIGHSEQELEAKHKQKAEYEASLGERLTKAQRLKELEQQLNDYQSDHTALQKRRLTKERDYDKIVEEVNKLEGKLSNLEEAARAYLEALQEKQCRLDVLQALGRGGIPQLLIEQALPRLQEIVDAICQGPFDNRFRLWFDTQKQSQSGHAQETFAIWWNQGAQSWDVASCSGGQRAAARVILRVALYLYGTERGVAAPLLLMDEATAHQDSSYREGVFAMLTWLQEESPVQIIFVTHDDLLAYRFPQVIQL